MKENVKNTAELNVKPEKKNVLSFLNTQKVAVQAPLLEDRPKGKWTMLWSEYRYLGFAFLIPVILMYLLYVAMEIHPFGNGSVLVLDLNAQYVYFYEALRAWIYGDGSLLYSFGRSLGGEFMGIYAYYIASPFS